ncbi:TetR/AcrR family transcriptional regulator [Salinibacillus xinjiangensis]|uniref:TetR family transcriptional regulator n=1 Tax=Salinibacillus xinjiangensis TaxID=1229268 RepID=A0A6G1X4U7_9BACI|nr:TetR/AcrR family transcriptional regulator [Salinibacillus xinjiangensis]MRG86023.1 TetR family transcriptional regulator [Salinibacillus xinjiangensis]
MAPRVSEEHLQRRRADILNAATNVFMEKGYENTTMKHIMEAAGVSRGGLYQYFANKEDLFEALLEEGLHEEATNIEQLMKSSDSHWGLLMEMMFGKSRNPDAKMDPLAASKLEFFITGRNDDRRRAYGQKRYKLGVRLYADVIKAGQDAGEFSDRHDHELLAKSIITFIDGLALDDAILPEDEVQIEKQSKLFVEYLKMALEVQEI